MGLLTETQTETDERFMRMALDEARQAADEDEVPIGAVIVCGGRVIARGHNRTEALCDITAHAEMQALTAASGWLGGKYLPECTLYVTVEPCAMCAGALGWSQIGRIVWGADDTKRGYRVFCHEHRTNPDCGPNEVRTPPSSPLHPKTLLTRGVLADECADLIRAFFRSKR